MSMDPVDLAPRLPILPRDVNSRQNRVPTETEARGLRSLRESQRRIIGLLDSELEKVSSTCSSISARNTRLLLEVDAGKSELQYAQQVLKTLQTQRMKGLGDIAGLDAILHPVRRMPPELLQQIFKTYICSTPNPLKQAIIIASVCQRWRAVALDTPMLWNDISIWPEPDALAYWTEFGRELGARLRSTPAVIHVQIRSEAVATGFHLLRLDLVPGIKELELQFDTNPLLIAYSTVARPLPHVVSAILRMSPTAIGGRLHLRMAEVHKWFPNAEALEIEHLYSLQVPGHVTYPHIRQLGLANGGPFNLPRILRSLPHLKQLSLAEVELEGVDVVPELTLPHLEYLQLSGEGTGTSNWINKIKCPSLKTLIILDHSMDDVFDFLASHRSVETLELDGQTGYLAWLDQVHPNLKRLHVGGPYDEFVAHDAEPLLKSLETLVVSGDTLTLAEFESVVRARALGRNHPLSQLATHCAPLDFRVCIDSNILETIKNSPDEWPSSDLYQTSRREVHKIERWTNYVEISLSWD